MDRFLQNRALWAGVDPNAIEVQPYFDTYHLKLSIVSHPPTPYALAIMTYFRDLNRQGLETQITK